MSSRFGKTTLYAATAAVFFMAGWACQKAMSPKPPLGDGEVVAVVDGHRITFGEWMRQVDLLRVTGAASLDPDNANQVKAVLDSLIDQQLVLDAAKKAGYQNASFDQNLKGRLLEAEIKIKDVKDKLHRDMETVKRIEGKFEEPLKKMLLAREYAASRVGDVVVTEKDLRDWYYEYTRQAKKAGQKLPAYNPEIGKKIKGGVQAEKFLEGLQTSAQVVQKQEVIDKYLHTLSASRQMLDGKEGGKADPLPTLDLKGGKP